MRVIIVHNHYQQPGGEDVGVQDEFGVLTNHGHQVRLLEADNDHITNFAAQVQAAFRAVYSFSSKRRVAAVLSDFKPDLVHVHNFFPVFSPSIYYACDEAGVAVVQTLHNYRLICPSGILFRDGHVCEDCVSKSFAWPGALHGCYRNSRFGTAAVAAMASVHRGLHTYERKVQKLIALTDFSRRKFIEGGLPANKLVVKPPFIDTDFGVGSGKGGYVLFVGRLSEEKGIVTLLEAWKALGGRIPLRVAGGGPLKDYVLEKAAAIPGVEYLGFQSRQQINQLMQDACALVFPSEWYEGVPRTILESFAAGTPVIASGMGNMLSLVDDHRTGLHFQPGNSTDLAAKVNWMLDHPNEWWTMRQSARKEYEAKYTAERNYELLMEIYDAALRRSANSTPEPEPAVQV